MFWYEETEKEISNYFYSECCDSSIHELLQLEYTKVGTCVNESKVRHMEKILLKIKSEKKIRSKWVHVEEAKENISERMTSLRK